MYVLILALIVGVAAVIPSLDKRGMKLSIVSLNAFVMLSISPISWSHHNTWFPLIIAAICVDAVPWLFWRKGPERTIALVLAWVAAIGLYISPMWIGIALYGSSQYLDYISTFPLVVSAIPIICLFVFFWMWIIEAWRNRNVDDSRVRPELV